jgi:hypothetical protein
MHQMLPLIHLLRKFIHKIIESTKRVVIYFTIKPITMKQKFLLLSAVCFCAGVAEAQIKAYAITGSQKGSSNWSEVRLVDASTGDELKTIYQNSQEIEKFNARTGKPIAKIDVANVGFKTIAPKSEQEVTVITHDGNNKTIFVRKAVGHAKHIQTDAPFATSSAALAYDKKHDRLYYTPMGINELRYIDMKSKTTKVYYFEGEAFGALKGRGDVQNQVTRMVIAADGKGYALTNNADHLIQFETDKKPDVKDLGALIDDPANGNYSIHSGNNYGGDMIADAQGNLWLITANRRVYKIDMETLVATFKGSIKGLPAGFSTNGAIVEKNGEASVIVCSSTSTQGYFRFDLNTLQSEKVTTTEAVYNASDLANGNIAFSKKKKKDDVKEEIETPKEPQETATTKSESPATGLQKKGTDKVGQVEGTISVYPNPVTTGVTKIAFKDHAAGRYQVQVMDISGKLLSTQSVNINNKLQVEQITLPSYIAKGNYMLKVVNQENKVVSANPIIVQ